ncbi:MAG: flagellar export protein FliJ [Cyanobacteriota bacterium]
MKKFNFRFQTILDIRTRELEKAELKVAEAQRVVLNAKNYLKELQDVFKQVQLSLKKTVSARGQINISWVENHQKYLRATENKIFKQHKVIKEAENKVDEIRKEMLLIRQKKLMLDKIKEKDYKNYLKEYELQDIKIIDEIATSRFKRD